MIEFRVGNLLEDDAEALVNAVNCVGVVGKGLDLQFRQAYPENYQAYHRACEAGEVRPGNMLVSGTGSVRPRWIINFPTKRDWRSPSNIDDIADGLDGLVATILRLGIRSVAIPPLGSAPDNGLDWPQVRALISERLGPLNDVAVRVYEPTEANRPNKLLHQAG
jgi:O-acetyl-ADP-ribose deacetylase (regulator of RNase III)